MPDTFWITTPDVSFVSADDIWQDVLIIVTDSGSGVEAVIMSPMAIVVLDGMGQLDTPDLFYKFEDDFTDDGTEGEDLTKTGTVDFEAAGHRGKCAKADGGYLSNATYEGPSSDGAWTLSFRFRTNYTIPGGLLNIDIFKLYDYLFSNTGFTIRHHDQETYAAFRLDTSTGTKDFATTITDSDWHHVAFVYDGTDVKYYLDGVDQDDDYTVAFDLDPSSFPGLIIFDDDGGSEHYLDEVQFWDRELSAAEIYVTFLDDEGRFKFTVDAISTLQEFQAEVFDSGAGSEIIALQITSVVVPDAATGTDIPSRPIDYLIEDTVTGSDQVVLSVTSVIILDSGVGSEVIDLLGAIWVDTDGATFVDADDVWAPHQLTVDIVVVADSGIGTDEISIPVKTVLAEDTGTVVEQYSVSVVSVVITDSAAGTEEIDKGTTIALAIGDSGIGTDGVVVVATIPIIDSALGTDITALRDFIWVDSPDAFVFIDDADFKWVEHEVQLDVIEETGTGTEVVAVDVAEIVITDTAVGTEVIDLSATFMKIGLDSGAGSEELLAAVSAGVVDGAVGDQVEQVSVGSVVVVDSGLGDDPTPLLSVSSVVVVSDSGQGTEAIALTTLAELKGITDQTAGTDAALVGASSVIYDSATGTDEIFGILPGAAIVLDSGDGTESVEIAPSTIVSDSGDGSDVPAASYVSVVISDSGYGEELLVRFGADLKQVVELALGYDSVFVPALEREVVDAGAGSELVIQSAATIVFDSAVGIDGAERHIEAVVVADSGVGTEQAVVSASLAISDFLELIADVPVVSAANVILDSGTGTDVPDSTLLSDKVVVDYGTFVDTVVQSIDAVIIYDSALGVINLKSSSQDYKEIEDLAIGTDVVTVLRIIERILLSSSFASQMVFDSGFTEWDEAVNE